jgi:hypothetical protein
MDADQYKCHGDGTQGPSDLIRCFIDVDVPIVNVSKEVIGSSVALAVAIVDIMGSGIVFHIAVMKYVHCVLCRRLDRIVCRKFDLIGR